MADLKDKPILLTGATGYVGGRLAPRLLEAGFQVRALGRSLAKLACRPWANHRLCQLAQGDVLDAASLHQAARGCSAAYYLVHSMNPGSPDFAAADRQAARNMREAAQGAGLERLIYLGGLVPDDPHLSHHLRSRAEVGRILQSGPVPCTWLRAAVILGAGSASFELMRYLVDRLPMMITPRWVATEVQPIGIGNVLGYLQGCLEHPEVAGRALDIGGPQVLSYHDMFQIYAQEAGLSRRWIIRVPLFTPKLSSYWIHLVTPVPAALARPLTEGLRNRVVAQNHDIKAIIPQRLLTPRQTIRRALERIEQQKVETCWMDAWHSPPPEWPYCADAPYSGGTVLGSAFEVDLAATPEQVWPALAAIGGEQGWYAADALWRLRGMLDRLLGGVGLRRGRRYPRELMVGDALDFWRVLLVEPPHRLLLLAEMKLPGQATLEFVIQPQGEGGSRLQQVARFLPRGLAGMAYWYLVHPLHSHVFRAMLKGLAGSLKVPVTRAPRWFDFRRPGACALPPQTR